MKLNNRQLDDYRRIVLDQIHTVARAEERLKVVQESMPEDHKFRKEVEGWYELLRTAVMGQGGLISIIEPRLTNKQREEVKRYLKDNLDGSYVPPTMVDPAVA